MRNILGLSVVFAILFAVVCTPSYGASYVVVVSKNTKADPQWRRVVEALVKKHHAGVITYDTCVTNSLQALREQFPRYACFVATPAEAGRAFVAQVHQLTRQLDDDPYTDCFWGILTGYDASNAFRIATCREPLVVRKVASATEIALDMCVQGLCYDELTQGKMVRKEKGGQPQLLKGPNDTTEALVKALNEYKPDAFVTSGHASERNWMIGYAYRNGQFCCSNGVVIGVDTKGNRYPVHSPNPKVYLPIGNCLMGHIDGTNAMALAYMNSAGVNQMMGYTVPTGYGFGGWGCLDYFLEQPGRYTFAEAFFANQAALIYRLQAETNNRGLRGDRDTVAFYGDPAWEARMAPLPCAWDQKLSRQGDVWTLDITPRRGDKSFDPINTNGSERGYRPIIQFLPCRVKNIELAEGKELNPVITDTFVLIPNPRHCDMSRTYRVTFHAERIR